MAQTVIQILRCLTLGSYTSRVVDGSTSEARIEVEGPQPLAGPLPASIRERRRELVEFLTEWAGGAWPPTPGSGLREVQQFLGCGLAIALDEVEAAQRRAA